MNEPDDYPLAPFVSAARTVLVRLLLIALAIAVGAYLGGLSATHSWLNGLAGLLQIHTLAFNSIFFSVGIIALPATVLFAVLFVRSQWPLWTVVIVTLLMWWNTHKTLYWVLHESASAKIQQALETAFRDTMGDAAKQPEVDRKKSDAVRTTIPLQEITNQVPH